MNVRAACLNGGFVGRALLTVEWGFRSNRRCLFFSSRTTGSLSLPATQIDHFPGDGDHTVGKHMRWHLASLILADVRWEDASRHRFRDDRPPLTLGGLPGLELVGASVFSFTIGAAALRGVP
jgi:hypothetical protein